MRPPIELTLTILPLPARRKGSSACVTATWPIRLTSSCWRRRSIGMYSSGAATAMPALLTRPARRPPPACSISSRAEAIEVASVTSSFTGCTRSPRRRSASSSLRTPASTSKPRPARCVAVASPIPVDAPVTTTLPPLTMPKLSEQPLAGRTVVVTGASSGIGAAGAEELGRLGAEVVPVGRDQRRLAAVAERIDGAAEPLTADFASLDEVRSLAERLLERHPEIHVLVNNAGTVSGRRELSEDGYELILAVNHLAPFLLTNLLLDRLRQSAPARVVTTSSVAHAQAQLDLDDLQLERGWSLSRSYGNSKLANVLFTRALARRLDGDDVVANCFHPGTVRTAIARDTGLLRALAWRTATMFASSPAKGASTLVHLAASLEAADVSGEYFVDSKPGRTARRATDDDVAERLWAVSEQLTGLR